MQSLVTRTELLVSGAIFLATIVWFLQRPGEDAPEDIRREVSEEIHCKPAHTLGAEKIKEALERDPEPTTAVKLSECRNVGLIPPELRTRHYFDLESHPFEHKALLTTFEDVVSVLDHIHSYLVSWLRDQSHYPQQYTTQTVQVQAPNKSSFTLISQPHSASPFLAHFPFERVVCPSNSLRTLVIGHDVTINGGILDLTSGDIYLGDGVLIEPGVTIKGPSIIGSRTVLRSGAYIRSDTILGSDCVIRCETKNCVIMDKTELPHPGYVGDSLLGYKSHFGCQALTANLGLLANPVTVTCSDRKRYDTGRLKMGVILGDFSQMGCNSVAEPGAMVAPRTHIYPLTRLQKGFYGPDEIIKNKPLDHGVIERVKLREGSFVNHPERFSST